MGDTDGRSLCVISILRITESVISLVYTLSRNEKVGEILIIGIEARACIFLDELIVKLVFLLHLLLENVELVEGLNKHSVVVGCVKLLKLKLPLLRLGSSCANARELRLFLKNKSVVTIADLKTFLKCLLLTRKVNDSTADTTLVKKSVHLVGNSRNSALLIDFFASGEDYILNRLFNRVLVNAGVTYLSDKCGVVKQLAVNAEEHLACRKLAKHRRAGLNVNDRRLLAVCRTVGLVGGNCGTVNCISLATDTHVHRAVSHAGIPIYSLFSLLKTTVAVIGKAIKHIPDKCGNRAFSGFILALNNVDTVGKLEGHVIDTTKAFNNDLFNYH